MSSEHHNHSNEEGRRGLTRALFLTAFYLVAELIGGYVTNSLALLADAGHMLSDAVALGLSLFALWFATRPATPEKTYGYYRVEILMALVNGVALVLIAFAVCYEGYHRLGAPPPVNSVPMLLIAVVGLMVNLASAYTLRHAHHGNLNLQGAFLHIMGDALGSVGAIVAGFVMWRWHWYLADPIISILVSLLILYSSWRLLRDSVDVLLEGTPSHINITAMKDALASVEGVESLHDLHVWTLTSGMHAMSCHAVVLRSFNRHEILEEMSRRCREAFRIEHTTIQIEEESLQAHETKSCHELK